MGKKDSSTKKLMQNNEIFADAFNLLVYNGKKVINPDDLQPLDTTSLVIPFKGKDSNAVQKYRDVLKKLVIKRTPEVAYVVLGIENQSDIHMAMPVRNMLYDAIQYANQVEELSKQNKHKGEVDFLSGLEYENKLMPVVTLTVYFGAKPWFGPKSLKEMLNIPDKSLAKFIQDYKIYLVCPQLPDKKLDKLSSNLREVMKVIKYSQKKSDLNRLFTTNRRYKSIDTDAAIVIKDMTNLEVKIDAKKEKTNMCKAWEDLKVELLAKGKKEGEKIGEKKGEKKWKKEGIKLEQARNIKENLKKAKALVKAGTAKEIVAKIMGVNIALL